MSTIEEEIDRFYRGELNPEELNELAYQVGEITGQDLFEGQRTTSGQAIESGKAFARDFAGSFATAAEGAAELSDALTNYIGLDDLIDSGEDNELVRLARGARESLSNYITSDPVYRDTFATKFGGGLGSFGSFLVPGGALKLAGLPKLAGATTATQAIGSGSGDQAQRLQAARDQGIEIDQATEDAAIGLGGIVGFTELLPVNRVLSKISKSADAQFKKGVVNKIKSALVTGTAEAVQEASAGVLQDAIEKGFYNEELTVGESLFDDLTVGGAVGAFADLAVSSAAGLGKGRERRKAEAAIRKTKQRYRENLEKRASAGLEEEAELAEERVEAAGQIPQLAQALQEEYESRPYQEDATTPEDLTEFQKILDEEMEAAGLGDIKANIFHGLKNVVKTEDGRILFGVRQRRKNEKDIKSFGRNSNLVFTDEIQEGEGFYSDATGQIFLTADTLSKDKTFEEQAAEAVGTLKHEQIHAMRALDLFKDSEWELLSNVATKQLKKGEQRTYYEWALETYKKENLGQEELIEEAIAEMARDARTDKTIVTGKPRTLLQRIIDFFPKLTNFLKGSGYVSFDSLVRDIDSGVIGKRKKDVIRTDKDFAQFKESNESRIKKIVEEEQETKRQEDFYDPNVQEEVAKDKFSRSFPSSTEKLKDFPETNILAPDEEAIPFDIVFKDKKSLKAYHGSAADFNKFMSQFMGTGEGAQAFGYGLYFAQKFGIADFYKNKLSSGKGKILEFAGEKVMEPPFDPDSPAAYEKGLFENALKILEIAETKGYDVKNLDFKDVELVLETGSKINESLPSYTKESLKGTLDDLFQRKIEDVEDDLLNKRYDIDKDPDGIVAKQKTSTETAKKIFNDIDFKPTGKLYTVELDAEFDDFLKFDTELYEQSDNLLTKILSNEDKLGLRDLRKKQKELLGLKNDENRKRIEKQNEIKTILQKHPVLSIRGEEFYYGLASDYQSEIESDSKNPLSYYGLMGPSKELKTEAQRLASLELSEKGVPGIAFLDADSRDPSSEAEPTFNFVVFNDNLITIKDKFRKKGKKTGSEEARQAVLTKPEEKDIKDLKETVFADEEGIIRDKFSRKDFSIPIQVTSLDLMPTPQEVEKMRNGTFVPEKKRTLVEAAQFLQDRWEAATGRTTPYEYTSENIDLLSQIFFEQAVFALERDGNAIGWYDSKLKAAKRIMKLVDPRIMRTRDSEALFDFVLSVTSNGQPVIDNFGIATDIFRFHAKKGRFPETFEEFQKGGERNDAMLQAFKFHNAWQKSGQNQSIVDFLSDDYTVKELDEFAKKFNEQLGYEAMKVPSAEGVNVAVKGSYVLGPKIGQGFYQNLRGNYNPLTTDIWWMRFWNRAIGRPFKNALNDKDRNERRKEIKELMQKSSGLPRKLTNDVLKGNDQSRREIYRDPELLDSFIQDLEARYQKYYKEYKKEKGVNHVKPELFKKTGTYVKNMEPQLQADPKNASERIYIREVVEATKERLAEAGFDITTADFQALMWYPEKQLFRKLGVMPGRGEDVDYLDAAIALAEKEGISRGEIEKALRDTDRERTVDDQPSARREDGLVREDVAGVPSRDQEKTLTREKPLTQKSSRQASKIEKAVQENNEEIAKTPASRVPRYTNRADPEAQYVARNPEEGLTPDDLLKDKFSRRNEPNTSKETSDAIDKIASNAAPRKTPGETYLDVTKQSRLGYFLTRLKQEAINKYARLEQYSRDPMFKDNLADSSAIAAALFADRSMGIVASALKDGVAVYRNGMVRVEDFFFEGKRYKGLVDVMAPLYQNQYGVSLERLAQAYAIIKRSENLTDKKTPIEGMSPEEIEKVKQEAMQYVDENGNSIIEQWYKTWSAYNRKTVEFMQDTGLLTEELAQEWLTKSDYVPFYRQAEAEEGEIVDLGEDVPAMFKRSMTTSFRFAELKGSEKAVNVPMLDAITRNLSMAIDAGMKNIAQQRIIRDMIQVGVAQKATDAQKKNKSQNFVVDFKVNGIDQSYVVRDPLIYESLQSISESGGLMWTAVGMPSKWLRELVTRSPDFMIANLIRDTLSAYVTSGADFTPVLDTITGFADGAERLERFGVVGGYDFANDPDDMVKAFSKYAKERGVKLEKNLLKSGAGAVFKPFTSLWNALGKGTTLSDAATRNAVYNDVLARTGNEAEAAFQALEVINFSRRGRSTLARFITTAIPFLNARMQGLDVLFRGFLGVNPAQRQLTRGEAMATALARSSLITGSTLLYWLLTSDDEEYKKATDEQRDLNWLIPTGTGIPIRIPVPFEVGLLFKTIPERIFDRYPLAQTFGKPGATSSRELEESIARGVTSTLAVNPLGMQFIAPLAEAYINYDFFSGRQIVPIYLEKQGIDGLIDRYSSTEISKLLGKALNVSPIKIDHVLTGYTGTLGTSAILMADRAWKSLDPSKELPSLSATELPIIRRFFLSKFSSDNIQDFYRLRDEVGKLESSLDKLVEQGRMTEFEALSSSQLGIAEYKQDFLDVNELLSESRRNIRAIEESQALTPEEKTMLIDLEIQDMELNTAIVPTIKRTLNLPSRTFQLVPLLTEEFKADSEQKNAVQK